jgi:CheY-like chemotaxis protein
MDKENFLKLRKLSNNLSILYIEDDKSVQNEVGKVLGKLFDTFYQAYSSEDGLKIYKDKKPSLVITSVDFSNKEVYQEAEGIDLVIDIKGENDKAKIIVLSKKNKDFELLEIIDLDVVELLEKPYEVNKLLDAVLVAISQVQKQEIDTRCIAQLKETKQQNLQIECYSDFKGVFTRGIGTLVDVKDDEFIVALPKSVFIAVKYSKKVVLYIQSTKSYIEANLFDIKNDSVVLVNPKFISGHMFNSKQKHIHIDKSFKAGLYHKNVAFEAKVTDLSYNSVTLYFENLGKVKLGDKIDITLGVELDSVSSMIKEKRFHKAFANGKILKIEKYRSGYKILSLLKIQKASKTILDKYLKQREIQIIAQLKYLLRESK